MQFKNLAITELYLADEWRGQDGEHQNFRCRR